MNIIGRPTQQGFPNLFDWEIGKDETVIVKVLEIRENKNGKRYAVLESKEGKFHHNLWDGLNLREGESYSMLCTGHSEGGYKYLNFTPLPGEYNFEEPQVQRDLSQKTLPDVIPELVMVQDYDECMKYLEQEIKEKEETLRVLRSIYTNMIELEGISDGSC